MSTEEATESLLAILVSEVELASCVYADLKSDPVRSLDDGLGSLVAADAGGARSGEDWGGCPCGDTPHFLSVGALLFFFLASSLVTSR